MRTTFAAYTKHCLGLDEYEPVSGVCRDWAGLGLTVLDSVDTLVFMGLDEEYAVARRWARRLNVRANRFRTTLFEVVIRALGGLNSAYALTHDRIWRTHAVDLGDALLHAFGTRTGCPNSQVTLNDRGGRVAGTTTSVAEAGTLQLEFRTLSAMSGDKRYAAAADRCQGAMLAGMPNGSLVPRFFDVGVGTYVGDIVTIGGAVDSFVEMLLKTWIAFGKKDDDLRIAFERSVEHAFAQLAVDVNGTLLLGEAHVRGDGSHGPPAPTMEHLSCFFPGALALAALHGLGGGVRGTARTDYMPRARRLMRACFLMSRSNPHGLAPEEVNFAGGHMWTRREKDCSLLRPEIVESLYVMHTVTGGRDPVYREWGRLLWDSIEQNATLWNGRLASTYELYSATTHHRERLHSFVPAETLKYFFLLFREEGDGPPLSLTSWVLNTEAHPVPVRRGVWGKAGSED